MAATVAALSATPVPFLAADDLPWRDVLAGAFLYPFLTDAEVAGRMDDTRAWVEGHGTAVTIRYPGISGALAGEVAMAGAAVAPDLWRGVLPAGRHLVTILTGGEASAVAHSPAADDDAVSTAEAFMARAALLGPGDELVVADGVYSDWRLQVDAQGTAATPILIRPRTPGGVTFRRDTRLRVTGRHVVLKGFRFDHCGPDVTVLLAGALDCRVTQCHFFHCGNPLSTFGHIVRVDAGSHRNRVDHCFFTGSKSMSLAQRITTAAEIGTHNRFDHNVFRDIYRYWINGQENIQIGQNQRGASGAAESFCTVEYNLFDHAWGDGEIISNKSSSNVIRFNLASHCRRSAFTLRGGDRVRFEGNAMVHNGDGLRVMGRRHTIVNNLIRDMPGFGILLETGHEDGESNVATAETLIAHNTIVDCLSGAIGAADTAPGRPHRPARNTLQNNLLSGSSGTLLDTRFMLETSVRRNLVHAAGGAVTGDLGDGAVTAEPRWLGEGWDAQPALDSPAVDAGDPMPEVVHDRRQRRRPGGTAPDLGADEADAPAPLDGLAPLPPVPPAPLLAPSLYRGEPVFVADAAQPESGWRVESGTATADGEALHLTDAAASLAAAACPIDCFIEWEYRPAAFASRASLTFGADAAGVGYTLSWGGLAKDGKHAGLIVLHKGPGKAAVADGADILQYYQDFRHQAWLDRTRNVRTEPDPAAWYRFTLLKRGGRMLLLLGDGSRSDEPGLPVLVWDDDGTVGGPALVGTGLRLQQQGTGHWRRLSLATCVYTGDRTPAPPRGLTAQAAGGSRITLSWDVEGAGAAGLLYAVHRGTAPGFVPGPASLVATLSGRTEWHDMTVQPQTRYAYQVIAANALGLKSDPAAAMVTTGTGGAFYQVIDATEAAAVELPMQVPAAAYSGRRFLWAPPGSPQSLQTAPAQGSAVFRFTVAAPGTYAIWGLVQAPNNAADSFHAALAAVDGGSSRIWYTGIHPVWGWSRIFPAVELPGGEHALTIRPRESGTRLGAVLVTDDVDLIP